MKNYRMMDIHIDALALAAGVRTLDNMAVSHPPSYPRVPKHRLRRTLAKLLARLSRLLSSAAKQLEPAHTTCPC